MRLVFRLPGLVGALVLGLALLVVTAPTAASGTGSDAAFWLKIAPPTTVPAQPVAGKPFAVLFRVTRSDTNAPVRSGTMICDPAVTGTVIRHTESFTGGSARLSFVIPSNAAGKTLSVHLTIKALGKSAHTVAVFNVGSTVKPVMSVSDASVTEGNTGTTTLAFPVTLSSAASQVVTVSYSTADGTATAPSDYVAANGTLTFRPGERTKSIAVSVIGDTAFEPDETFTVSMTSPVNATVVTGTATGTIRNDDAAPPPAKSGHYKGSYSDGDFIEFDVAGMQTGNFYLQNNGHCSKDRQDWGTLAGYAGARGPFTIQPDGSFSGTDSYTTNSGTVNVNVTLSGKLASDGSATGNVSVSAEFTSGQYSGISCKSTGTWAAHVQP
jgi:Calx-beta domain-containing protein